MVMFSLTCKPWNSRMENNLNIFIAEFSDFNRKLSSLEKLYLLQDLSSSTWRYCQRVINSNNSLCPIWNISSHSLTKMEDWLLHRGGGSWNLLLSMNYWIPNYIYHFSSSLSSFWSFNLHQHWYSNSPVSYCSSLISTEDYLWILWNNLT